MANLASHGTFTDEVVSEVCRRPEGICVKHRVKANSVKMYDKGGGRVLRNARVLDSTRAIRPSASLQTQVAVRHATGDNCPDAGG